MPDDREVAVHRVQLRRGRRPSSSSCGSGYRP